MNSPENVGNIDLRDGNFVDLSRDVEVKLKINLATFLIFYSGLSNLTPDPLDVLLLGAMKEQGADLRNAFPQEKVEETIHKSKVQALIMTMLKQNKELFEDLEANKANYNRAMTQASSDGVLSAIVDQYLPQKPEEFKHSRG